MIYLACAIGLAALAIPFVYLTDSARTTKLRKALDDRSAEIDTYRESVMEMAAEFAATTQQLAKREADERALVINALISDRNRLVTAVLVGNGSSPAAATLLTRSDQAEASTQRAMSLRDLFDEVQGERTGPATEYEDERGHAIVPVGMGS